MIHDGYASQDTGGALVLADSDLGTSFGSPQPSDQWVDSDEWTVTMWFTTKVTQPTGLIIIGATPPVGGSTQARPIQNRGNRFWFGWQGEYA